MSTNSGIEWTDATWNPVVGCAPVSPGCLNCYAATMARRLEAMRRPEYVGLTVKRDDRAVFNGTVRTLPERLKDPLHWRNPRMIFVNSMSDLFHEDVPFEFIDRVFAVMALCPQHTFQVLTKRPERMAEYLRSVSHERSGEIATQVLGFAGTLKLPKDWADSMNEWPLPNVWLGTSVEDQTRADERIPHLLRCPAEVRFLSCEPLLGPVDLSAYFGGAYVGLPGDKVHDNYNFGLHWVIVGGESGAHARPCDVGWIRSIVGQCKTAGVPVFVKQLGAKPRCTYAERGIALGAVAPDHCADMEDEYPINDRKGGDMAEWPEDLRVREMPTPHGGE